MPKVTAEKQYNTFIAGLVTEANPLTYPENASLDEDNFVLERNGKRARRLGVDYESGYGLQGTGLAEVTIQQGRQSFHRWDSPGGNIDISIGVIRVQERLWFINLFDDSPSNAFLNSGNYITITGLGSANLEATGINGSLLLASSDLSKPILLDYDSGTDTVSQAEISLEVRDLWGVDDGLTLTERPTTLSTTHRYNLRNQGWSERVQSTCGTDAIDCTYSSQSFYPSNADIWTLGKIGDSNSANFEKYDPATMKRNSFDNAPAPKGAYIIDAFNRGSSRESKASVSGLPTDIESGRITSVTAYASRVFYSGVTSSVSGGDAASPNFSGYVFFSPVVTSNDVLGKCYQEADPTSPDISDIVDTDGGTIQIPEATRIVKLVSAKSSLLVFAENGVWEVFGDTGGFIATSFQLSKVSSVGISNSRSVVEANGVVFYWSKAGIYMLTQDQASARYSAENISLITIQTLYNDLAEVTKNNSRGFYDERENRIRWLYNDTNTYSESNYLNRYNRELVLDLTLRAFYTNTIEDLTSNSPWVCDYVDIPGYSVSTITEDIYVGSDQVLVSTDNVAITTNSLAARSSQFSFLTFKTTSFTLSKYSNSAFKDWITADGQGVDFSSYLVTGYELFGDVMRTKQIPYIFFYFERTEDGYSLSGSNLILDNQSSCLVQAQWNWTNSATSGKWGTQFQAYRFLRNYIPTGEADTFDYSETVIVTKNRLRGSGKCLSLKIQSEAGKDMKLLGWSVVVSGDGKP